MNGTRARLRGIRRSFGSVVALDGADLALRAGEVHGVLGANGAGKSTLLNILGGLLAPDAGTLEVDDEAVTFASPRDAWERGIGLVHQHFTLVPPLGVIENLALGSRGADAAPRRVRAVVEDIMARTGLRVPLDARVEEVGVGDRQRIEILKVLLRDPRVLVLDEPTAVLTPDEVRGLFELLRALAEEGRAVALVAHKIDEVLSVADRLTVLRDGRTVLTDGAERRSRQELVQAMVGDEEADPIALGLGRAAGVAVASEETGLGGGEPGGARASKETEPGESDPGEGAGAGPVEGTAELRSPERGPPGGPVDSGSGPRVVARLDGVAVEGRHGLRLSDAHLAIEAGEVVGIAGVEGNGQRELALVLGGRLAPTRGQVELPEAVGFISQDRSNEGLIGSFDLTENVALALQRRPGYARGPWLRWSRLRSAAEEIRLRYDVAAPSVDTRAAALSGGNQQRVIVGRELAMASDLLVAENPTRGLDVTASAFVHDELRRLASEDVAVALISTDLDEVLALADRIFAIGRGRLTEVDDRRRDRESIGALMLGGETTDG